MRPYHISEGPDIHLTNRNYSTEIEEIVVVVVVSQV